MIIRDEIFSLTEHEAWSGAKWNYDHIIMSGKAEEFIFQLEDIYPDGITSTFLNDILWFDDEFCYQFINDEYLTEDEIEIKKSYNE